MKLLLFASMLTIAVVCAQATGVSDNKPGAAGTKKVDTRSRKGAEAQSVATIPKKGGKKSTGGAFEIKCYSFGASQTGVQKNSGGGAGKVDLNGLKIGGKKGANKAGKQPPAKRPESAAPAK